MNSTHRFSNTFIVWLCAALVLFLALPGIFDLFKPHYYTSHDGEGHVIRMEEFYRALKDGQFPVRWSKRLYYGYGYPFFNFNYPSVYYMGVPFMAAGFSAEDAMKAVTIATYLLSGLCMYAYLVKKMRPQFALLGSLLYLYAPYRMLVIYVRGSVAESIAFLFPPLLLWGVEAVVEGKKKAVLLTSLIIGFLGVSHNISALLLFGMYHSYLILYSGWKRSLHGFLRGLGAFGVGIAIAAFFFVPALAEKKYTFLDQTIARDYPDHFVEIAQLVKSGWGFGGSVAGPDDGLSFNLGWVHLAGVVLSLLTLAYILRQKDARGRQTLPLTLFLLAVFIGSVFFMMPISRTLWDYVPLLPFVQFPWRFIMLTVLALSILLPLSLQQLTDVLHLKWSWLFVGVLVSIVFYFAKDQWYINQSLIARVPETESLEGTTTWADEQATQWFQPKPKRVPDQRVEIVQKGAVDIEMWKTGEHRYSVASLQDTTVIENTMYYPGWRVWVDGKEVEVRYMDTDVPGRLVFSIPAGSHQVLSRLTEPSLRFAADMVSLISLGGVLIALCIPSMKFSKKKR